MNTIKLSPVHPKKPKIIALPYNHSVFNYLYICKDAYGYYVTYSSFNAFNFYANPSKYIGKRTRNLPKQIAMRIALSQIMRTGSHAFNCKASKNLQE